MTTPVPSIPFASLQEALDAQLSCLQYALPLRSWMIMRKHGGDVSVLHARDNECVIRHGMVVPWSDIICARMVDSNGPNFAERLDEVPLYMDVPIRTTMSIRSYIGHPLEIDGALVGTVCAIDSHAHEPFSPQQKEIVRAVTRTISTLIASWFQIEKARQAEARLRQQACTDCLTGITNRQGWEMLIAEEDAALRAYQGNALLMLIDLDRLKTINDSLGHAAGDQYLQRAAQAIAGALREGDTVARIGGDEFAVFIRNGNEEHAEEMVNRIEAAIAAVNVEASIGTATFLKHGNLAAALKAADGQMYAAKTRRR